MNTIKRVTGMLMFGLAAVSDLATADQLKPPVRLNISSELVTMLFHRGDQRMLDTFTDVPVPDVANLLDDCRFSLKTSEGVAQDSYDFDFSINDPDKGFMGFQATDLRVVGSANIRDTHFGFEAPCKLLRVEVGLEAEDVEEILQVNPNAKKPAVTDFKIEVGEVTLGDDFPKDGTEGELQALLRAELEKEIRNTYTAIWDGEIDKIANMPVESFLPMLALRHIGSFSKEFSLSPDSIEYGFDPEMYFERMRETPKKKKGLLKAIDSEFTPPEEDEDSRMFSLIVDENAMNSFILDFVLVEKAFSLREYFMMDPKLREIVPQMNTDALGLVLPEILQEYKSGLAVDFYASMSHSLIAKQLPETKVSGFQMDKNGNLRFVLNGSVTLLVQKERNTWEEARSIFASVTAKGKVVTKEISETEKVMVIFPKALELTSLKIFNKEEESQTMEEMVLTSGFNV